MVKPGKNIHCTVCGKRYADPVAAQDVCVILYNPPLPHHSSIGGPYHAKKHTSTITTGDAGLARPQNTPGSTPLTVGGGATTMPKVQPRFLQQTVVQR